MADLDRLRRLSPQAVRELLEDGNYGGDYQKPDEQMLALWHTAVQETREVIEGV